MNKDEKADTYLDTRACRLFVWGNTWGLRDVEVEGLVRNLEGSLNAIFKVEGALGTRVLAEMGFAIVVLAPDCGGLR